MFLIFDTETTGLPQKHDAPLTDFDNWPRVVQLAWQLHDSAGGLLSVHNYIIKPDGFDIPFNASKIHGITTERAMQQGLPLKEVLEKFLTDVDKAGILAGHNVGFDINIVGCELLRLERKNILAEFPVLDSNGEKTAELCRLPGGRGGKFKFPKLNELHEHLFGEKFGEAHNAAADVEATARCILELIRQDVFTSKETGLSKPELAAFKVANPLPVVAIGLNVKSYDDAELEESEAKTGENSYSIPVDPSYDKPLDDLSFVHLHNHSRFSVLQSTTDLKQLAQTAAKMEMGAVALTDNGNMFAVFQFMKVAIEEGVKPIVGCEVMVADHYEQLQFTREAPDRRFPLVLLARNKQGYHNLVKIVSVGFMKGYYGGIPRVGEDVIRQYSDNLICLCGGTRSEVGFLALNVGEAQAEECLLKWRAIFGEDFYIELVDHGLDDEKHLNEFLVRMAHKHGIKAVATNDTFYLREDNANAHDILLCVKDGEKQKTPIGRGYGHRNGMPNSNYYFKPPDEMKALFARWPQAIANTMEVADKVEPYQLSRPPILPLFKLPEGFEDQNDYLRHLTFEGARQRYKEITKELEDRLDYELKVIKDTGYPGYFLIVQDFTSQARQMGVWVGPGRGSAAGSAVAYCTGITNIDPINYKLLFERFLNPDRVSMPDIDIDFDDEGRERIMAWVTEKYGQSQVAQIVTYGTMGAKSALRDAARVMDIELDVVNRLCAIFPDHLEASLAKVLAYGEVDPKLKDKLNADQIKQANEFREIAAGDDQRAALIAQALILEGSLRNTGVHACGVIIAPDDLTNFIPLSVSRDAALPVTQYDKDQVEQVGLLKMDFLGLKTLTIIKDAIEIIHQRHGVLIDPDEIPIDDEKTFRLYQRGLTNGTFQFESAGMQKHLRNLKPTTIEDLIAMNALFRPGPMQFIDTFVRRKHGLENVEYPHPLLESILQDTFGIMVYQEQIMQTAQIIGGFTLGQADILRRAMGKKKLKEMESMKVSFAEGAVRLHDISESKALEIFEVMAKFAEYGFNRSHSAAYSVVAFQTGFLKAHYPAEYMAAVLSNNMSDIKKISFYMEECKRLNLKVLAPDINESRAKFTVNEQGEIRFALSAVKGVGEGVVRTLVEERETNGTYKNCFDFVARLDQKTVNKKVLEALVMSGAFDSFGDINRAQYFAEVEEQTFIDRIIRYGNSMRNEQSSSQISLFGDVEEVVLELPKPPALPEMDLGYKLKLERSVVGVYISGHPLDKFSAIIPVIATPGFSLGVLETEEAEKWKGRTVRICCMVTAAEHLNDLSGNPWGKFKIEDWYGAEFEFRIYRNNYLKIKTYLEKDYFLCLVARIVFNDRFGRMEIIPESASLLSDMRSSLKEIKLKVDARFLRQENLVELIEALQEHRGNTKVSIVFCDDDEKITAQFYPPGVGVELEDQLFRKIEDLNIDYEIPGAA